MHTIDLWPAPVASGPLDATVRVPGSKSLTARWLVLAALAEGPTVLHGALRSRDTDLMREALGRLGAVFTTGSDSLSVAPGLSANARALDDREPSPRSEDAVEVDCGLAGTVMRFVPLLAALHEGPVRFTGDDAALRRPVGQIIDILRSQNVHVTEHGHPGHLPFTVHGTGQLPGGVIHVDASASSQFLSAALLVAARADAPVRLVHTGASLPSLPHIEMTVQCLREAGVNVDHGTGPDGKPWWTVDPGPITLTSVQIEPDLSNAGPFMAAPLIAGGTVRIPAWPRSTTQPGAMLPQILTRMGAHCELHGQTMHVTGSGSITGIDVDLSACGELTPTVAALAALASSPSELTGIAHLRGHETDRLAALATELTRIGARTTELPDGLRIEPGAATGMNQRVEDATGEQLVFRSYEDHRMATAGAIIGLRVAGIAVENIATTAKTLPDFPAMWQHMLTS